MGSDSTTTRGSIDRLIHIAVILAIAGMLSVSAALVFGFGPITVGLSMFMGAPLLSLAILLYIVAVIRDLRNQGIL